MPTPRKTLAELAASGTLAKNLGRYKNRINTHYATGKPVGPPPAHLNAAERKIWNELVKAAPEHLLTKADRIAVEIAVRLVGRMRSPDVKTSELNTLSNLLGRLGLSPVDRLRLDLAEPIKPTKVEDDEWAIFET